MRSPTGPNISRRVSTRSSWRRPRATRTAQARASGRANARCSDCYSLTKSLARQRRALAERDQLGGGDVAAHRRHATIRAADDALLRHVFDRGFDGCSDILWTLDDVSRHVDDADLHVLALEQR